MNSSIDCHEIPDCPGLYIDAFRGHYLHKTNNPNNTFILTHYHGDHYGNLPSDQRYQGPAMIHCTPITAALLIRVHQVPEQFVRSHKYGQTWTIPRTNTERSNLNQRCEAPTDSTELSTVVEVTFYDANHCPGAAIVLIRRVARPNSTEPIAVHLHTGDMRYHPKMKSYPLLQHVAVNRQLDCLFLDTTYAHPKHNFDAQDVPINAIALQVQELLCMPQVTSGSVSNSSDSSSTGPTPALSTLVLLSCYSIGKERVLWEASQRSNQPVHVSEKKLQKLQCLMVETDEEDDNLKQQQHFCHQLAERCTTDPNASNLHVIPMGLAGEMWPFFQPNFWNCYEYASKLNTSYTKVVAFIPTGWAHATKWNQEHAISCKTIQNVDIEVRLVPYSEHSSFAELQEFVQFCKPRQIVPTVFSDAKDRRRIQARFPIDSCRAKQHFFRSMNHATGVTLTAQSAAAVAKAKSPREFSEAPSLLDGSTATSSGTGSPPPLKGDDESESRNQSATSTSSRKRKLVVTECPHEQELAALQAMGFATKDCEAALQACHGDVAAAVEYLLGRPTASTPSLRTVDSVAVAESTLKKPSGARKGRKSSTDPPSSHSKVKTILSYFPKKTP